jgi:hypothetical protein
MSISEVSRLPETLIWSTAKPLPRSTPCDHRREVPAEIGAVKHACGKERTVSIDAA